MKVRCPHCKSPLEILPDIAADEITCPSCGSGLSGVDQTLVSIRPDKRLVGRFELIEMVGRGYFGDVWRAHDTELRRTVAVKLPRVEDMNGEYKERFLREAKSAAQLRHPNIVPVHEVGFENGVMFIVSDFIKGMTLSELISTNRPSPGKAAELCRCLANALQHAHEAGVIHRDFKPRNVMIDQSGQPFLMDFGLAKQESGEFTMTATGDILGTPAYMSPEQARGDSHQADCRSDVYSLGVVLYELLTGERPFKGSTHLLLKAIQSTEPSAPSKLIRGIPRDLETICLKAMSKEPDGRYATALDIANDLQRFLNGESILGRRASSIERGYRWMRRNPVLSTACAVASAAIMTLAWVVFVNPGEALSSSRQYLPATSLSELPLLKPKRETSLLDRPPLLVAWRADIGQQTPRFDPKSKSYTIHSEREPLLVGMATHHDQPFVLSGRFSIPGRIGSAGFFWGLHTSNGDGIQRCYAITLSRLQHDLPWELHLEEHQLEQQGGDRFVIRTSLAYDSRQVQLDQLDHVRLVLEVSQNRVKVRLNDDVEWEPQKDEWAVPWLPIGPAQLGVLGTGSSTAFHDLVAGWLK